MSVNKVILVGNVGKDPEVRYFDKDRAVANLTLATSERGYTLANGTTIPERTEWHNLVIGGKLAEVAEKYIRKGSQLYVEGKIRTRAYDAKDGSKRYVTEILVENMQMLGKKDSGSSDGSYANSAAPAQNSYNQPTQQPTYNQAPVNQPITNAPQFTGNTVEQGEGDDLPF